MIPTNVILAKAVRGLIAVFEAGSVNTEQRQAIERVREILGEPRAPCRHENVAYEEGDALICQDCREDITPKPETVQARSR